MSVLRGKRSAAARAHDAEAEIEGSDLRLQEGKKAKKAKKLAAAAARERAEAAALAEGVSLTPSPPPPGNLGDGKSGEGSSRAKNMEDMSHAELEKLLIIEKIMAERERPRAKQVDLTQDDVAGNPSVTHDMSSRSSIRSVTALFTPSVPSVEMVAMVTDSLNQSDSAAVKSSLGACLMLQAVIETVILPNVRGRTSLQAQALDNLQAMLSGDSVLSARVSPASDAAMAFCREYSPLLIARVMQEPRSAVDLSYFMSANRSGQLHHDEVLNTSKAPAFVTFAEQGSFELQAILSKWASLVSLPDPIFGVAAHGLARCCSELLALRTPSLVVFHYQALMRQSFAVGGGSTELLSRLFTIDQNFLALAKTMVPVPPPLPVKDKSRGPLPRLGGRRDAPRETPSSPAGGERGACFAYNLGQPCSRTPCKFRHICSKCSGNHKAPECVVVVAS